MDKGANLEILAPKLLLPVLLQLPNLETLHNLLQASPASSRLFNLEGVEIFNTVLEADVNTHKHSRALIRIIVSLRAAELPYYVKDLNTF